MNKESLSAAYPPMLVVALGLVLFTLEWMVARPWLLAVFGLAGVGMVYLVVTLRQILRQINHREDEKAQAEERHRLIDRWHKRRDHKR